MSSLKATLRPASINKARAKAKARSQKQAYQTWVHNNPEEAHRIYKEGFNAAWAFYLKKPYRLNKYQKPFQIKTWQQGFQEGAYNYEINN